MDTLGKLRATHRTAAAAAGFARLTNAIPAAALLSRRIDNSAR